MTKVRLLFFLMTLLVVFVAGSVVFLYARGYRLNSDTGKFSPNGLLVIKSVPDGAQVFINGELKTATNVTLPLEPNIYDISVRKEGYISWNKRLTIDKEIVTEATAHLFKSVPSLSAITFSGADNPIPSYDLTKIGYLVPPTQNNTENQGLWIMETVNLPLGFSRDPRRITDGNLSGSSWVWSPDGREILLTTTQGVFLLDTGVFTSQAQRVNVAEQKSEILASWQEEKNKKNTDQIKKLPEEVREIMQRRTEALEFSPDEEMVLYTASSSATIPTNLIKKLPGVSTQKEVREIEKNKSYIYDLKEDKNFLIDDGDGELIIEGGFSNSAVRRISWYPSSRNLILAEESKITIMDYDGTNKQVVYSGSFISPHVYPTLSLDRLLILTNLGAGTTAANLYSLSLK